MLIIHTDGSSLNKRRLGAYAFTIHCESEMIHSDSGYTTDTTNNRMEMTGVLESLKYLNSINHVGKIEIISDSQYVIYSITKKWSKTKNVDLWKSLHKEHTEFIARGGVIKYSWVKGHSGIEHNETVDKMAGRKLKELESAIRDGYIVLLDTNSSPTIPQVL